MDELVTGCHDLSCCIWPPSLPVICHALPACPWQLLFISSMFPCCLTSTLETPVYSFVAATVPLYWIIQQDCNRCTTDPTLYR